MSESTHQTSGQNNTLIGQQNFLPDLCQNQAVFMLVLVAQLIALLLTIVNSGLEEFNWDTLALISFFLQWVVLMSAIILCRLKPQLRVWSPVRAGVTCYAVVLLVTLVVALLGQWTLHTFFGGVTAKRTFTVDMWQLLNSMSVAAILAGITLRYLYFQQQLRNQQQVELQARIQALQSRIRPHFLFNSMNSIASLIVSAPETAERVVEDLSELFRASLAEPALIPIARELDLCHHYLDIEKLRLGERLEVEWQLEALHRSIKIPSLLLQPLLENAVFHGIEPLPKGGRIIIAISLKGPQLIIKITNPIPLAMQHQKNNPSVRHNRMARDNIRHRLFAHYGNRARFSTAIDSDTFTTIIIYPIAPTPGSTSVPVAKD